MALALGLDVGTTTLSAVVLDLDGEDLVASHSIANDAATYPAPERAELDLRRLWQRTIDLLSEIVARLPDGGESIQVLGVTGQQHGTALLGPDLAPLGPAITWQDRRVQESIPGESESYLARFVSLAGGPNAFYSMGCQPAAGYLGPTLFWLHERGRLPTPPARACLVPDAVVSFLTGEPPSTDPTLAASSGLYDVLDGRWADEVIDPLGLPRELFPPVRPTGTRAGELLPTHVGRTGLSVGTPVTVAMGDNQASFAGAVGDATAALLINIGTGGQISARVDAFQRLEGFDTRPYLGDYLLVGAGFFGGRTYGYLRDFFRRVGTAFFGARGDEELWAEMNRLAAAVPPGAEGVRCVPLFTGSRIDPTLRASFHGLGPQTFTPGHLTRALLEGMAAGYLDLYCRMQPAIGERTRLVGGGNGLRRNPLLADILGRTFGLPLRMSLYEEEAAVGAARVAARHLV